jgi:hypothetical protein
MQRQGDGKLFLKLRFTPRQQNRLLPRSWRHRRHMQRDLRASLTWVEIHCSACAARRWRRSLLRAWSRHLVKSLLRRTWRRSSSPFSALVSGVGKNALDEAPPRPPQQVARAAASLNVGGMNQPRPPAEPGNRCSIGLSPMVSSRLREALSRPRIDRSGAGFATRLPMPISPRLSAEAPP